MPYNLAQVLAVRALHPFYNPDIEYPPSFELMSSLRTIQAKGHDRQSLQECAILWKKTLQSTIHRLIDDTSPENSFRSRVTMSITGGGSGSQPTPCMTDVSEIRTQRAEFGQFLRAMGVVQDGDWLLTVHCAGLLYRSLDLTTEIMENAGASVLSAGQNMSLEDVAANLRRYHVNILAGESNQLVQFTHYYSTLDKDLTIGINLSKMIYTSDVLSRSQRALIRSIFKDIKIFSLLGSAEAGPWAVSNPDLTGVDDTCDSTDFIFDTRCMKIEIVSSDEISRAEPRIQLLDDGSDGTILQTSLSKLRNPLVRYNTGDIGSLHPLPKIFGPSISDDYRPHLCILRLKGRDHRFSFIWDGATYDFATLKTFFDRPEISVLQWQVIAGATEDTKEQTLELRLMHISEAESSGTHERLENQLRNFFMVFDDDNRHRFKITFIQDVSQFERSETGGKIKKFVNYA